MKRKNQYIFLVAQKDIRVEMPDKNQLFTIGTVSAVRQILRLPGKNVRREMLGVTKKVWEQPGYPAECKDKTFKLTIHQGPNQWTVDASANEPILVAIERAGVAAPSRCRSGECGWCRSKLISGNVFVPKENELRRWADVAYGYIHPCSSFALSDIVLEVPGEYY